MGLYHKDMHCFFHSTNIHWVPTTCQLLFQASGDSAVKEQIPWLHGAHILMMQIDNNLTNKFYGILKQMINAIEKNKTRYDTGQNHNGVWWGRKI